MFKCGDAKRQCSDPTMWQRQVSAPGGMSSRFEEEEVSLPRGELVEAKAFEESSEPSTESGEPSTEAEGETPGCYMYTSWDGSMIWPSYDQLMDMQTPMYQAPVVWVPMQTAMLMQRPGETTEESASSEEALPVVAATPQMAMAITGVPPEWEEKYTVMMRNLPNKYTQQLLIEELNSTGFAGGYDFLYLPIDPETNANKGYAFVNFTSPINAWTFKMTFDGRKMSRFKSEKVVSVTPAALQGFEANYAHYSKTRVNRGDPSARPLFLRQPMSAMQARANGRGRSRRGNGSLIDAAVQKKQVYVIEMPQEAMVAPASARFCPSCGGERQCNYNFCQYCGCSFGEDPFTETMTNGVLQVDNRSECVPCADDLSTDA